jgi:hypothetical protein
LNNQGQLKHWLDPNGSDIAKIPGHDFVSDPNPGPVSSGPQRHEGQFSTCGAVSIGGGGGSSGTLLIGMLGGLLLRMRRRFAPH